MKTEATTLATRHTADGKTVLVWSDGALSQRLGFVVKGGKLPASVLWRVANDLALFDWAELPAVVRAAKRLAKRKALPHTAADFRAELLRGLS